VLLVEDGGQYRAEPLDVHSGRWLPLGEDAHRAPACRIAKNREPIAQDAEQGALADGAEPGEHCRVAGAGMLRELSAAH